MSSQYVILYGRGDTWNMKIFADSLSSQIKKKDSSGVVTVKSATRDKHLTDTLDTWTTSTPINELHILSHSIGGGLYLGYGDTHIADDRGRKIAAAVARGSNLTYDEVRKTEVGGVLTDDLHYPPFSTKKATFRAAFAAGAHIKIWGCNSAVKDWVYSDSLGDTPVYGEAEAADYYYWRALNKRHTPKPSIAQAFADYFNLSVFGASSGANIEVFHKKKWISSAEYKKKFGKYPPGYLPHRLHPAKGTYLEHTPAVGP